MNAEAPDVHQTIEYRIDATVAGLLPIGLGLSLMGLLAFVFVENESNPAHVIAIGCILLAAGLGVTIVALLRRSSPSRPVFVLSPAGVYYRIAGLKDFLVPWHEVQGIGSTDVEVWNWVGRGGPVTFHDVTVLLLTREFYDAHIHVGLLRRGPSWSSVFIPKGQMVQMALHHEPVSVDGDELRAAVEARWRAFRDSSAIAARRPKSALGVIRGAQRPRASAVKAAGADPRKTTEWQRIGIVVLLIGIVAAATNLIGVWATPGQLAAREERRKWREQEAQREAEQKKMMEDIEKRRKSHDDAMRRMWPHRP
jgi:hypothetical protein